MTKNEKFKVKAAFHVFTFLVGIYAIPLLIVALLNPLWFREWLLDWFADHLSVMEMLRTHLIENMVAKHRPLELHTDSEH
jgi:hypothetical protein